MRPREFFTIYRASRHCGEWGSSDNKKIYKVILLSVARSKIARRRYLHENMSLKEHFQKMDLSNDQIEKPTIVQEWLSKHKSELSSFVGGAFLKDGEKVTVKASSGIEYVAACASDEAFSAALKNSEEVQTAWRERDPQAKTRALYAVARTFQKHVNLFATAEAVTFPFKRVEKCRGSCAAYSIEYLYNAAARRNFNTFPPRCKSIIVVQNPKCSPMNLIAEWRIGEALSSNTPVVLVVAPSNCLPALIFAEICFLAGLPKGLLNVVIMEETDSSKIKSPPDSMLLHLYENKPHLSTCVIAEGADIDSAINGAIEMLTDCWGMQNYFGLSLLVQECILPRVTKALEAQVKTLKRHDSNFAKTVDLVSAAPVEISNLVQVNTKKANEKPTVFLQGFRTIKEVSSLVSSGPLHSECLSIWTEYVARAVEIANRVSGYRNIWINGQNLYDIDMDSLKELYFPSGQQDPTEKIHRTVPAIPQADVEHVPSNIDRTLKLYYGGAQKRPESNACYPVFNKFPPFDKGDKVLAYAPAAGPKDAKNAVEAALKAFPGWSSRSAFQRSQIIYFFGENLSQRRIELVDKLSVNTGHSDCEQQLQESIDAVFKWAGNCDTNAPSFTSSSGMKVYSSHEPHGVIAIICPPIKAMRSLITLLVGAISNGNTVVLIVPEEYPIAPLMLAQVIETSDIPAGVINILSGPTDQLLLTLAKHHDVAAVWCWSNRKTAAVEEACKISGKRSSWWFSISSKNSQIWSDEEIVFYRGSRKYVWLPCSSVFAN